MHYRKLGTTGITVSAVALGCWSFGGGGPWGPQEDADSLATVAAALDLGITFFDTAEGYGRSEEVLGKALEGQRDRAVIATKVSSDITAAGIRRACEQSLRRLRTDFIDLYQIHWPNPRVPIQESMEAMEKLREQGKVRAIGVSNFGPQQLTELLQFGHLVTNQISYSLVWRAPEFETLPLCREHAIGVLPWGPLTEGLLTGKYRTAEQYPAERRSTRYFSRLRPETSHGEDGCEEELFGTLARIGEIADHIGQPMAAVSLAWLLAQPGVVSVLAGARTPAQITENVRAADLSLPGKTLRELRAVTEPLKERLGPNLDMYLPADRSRIV